MKNKINTILKGLDFIKASEEEPLELIRSAKYRGKKLNIPARNLNHWDKMDLLLNKNKTGAWYVFSLTEAFWLKIVQKLRAYNLPIEIIKHLKNHLTNYVVINDELKIDDNVAEAILVQNKSFSKKDIYNLIKSNDFQKILKNLRPNHLECLLLDIIVTRSNYRILLNEKLEINFYNQEKIIEDLEERKIINDILDNTHINISLFEIIKDLVDDIGEDECSEYQNILTKDEAMVLKLLKQEDISKIEINFNDKTKKAETIKVTKNNSISNLSRVQDLILRNGYQDISIKTQKGKIVQCTNTTKYKLNTE